MEPLPPLAMLAAGAIGTLAGHIVGITWCGLPITSSPVKFQRFGPLPCSAPYGIRGPHVGAPPLSWLCWASVRAGPGAE
jgi:hypothetical protein